ncbi:MAG: hypothetical protein NTY08_13060 [Proteobacteria bacterium]|nr:hypothetical protein [Pseudomonadota bacterium]
MTGYPASSGSAQTGIARLEAANYNVLDIGQANAAPWGLWLQGTHRTSLGTTYPLLLNPNGGNVGIGTTAPTANLDVDNSANASTAAVSINAATGQATQLLLKRGGSTVSFFTNVSSDKVIRQALVVPRLA